jgi:tetratricopeptide (TPR) repeat protein
MCLHGSRLRPLILEIEDLHWIDASSEECLTALVERMTGAALLVLVTYRPGYRPPWVDKSYVTQVALQPLTQSDSLRVMQAVLPGAVQAAPLVPQLLAKAEGNPFFLEELARTVAEQGADASSSTVPDTIQAVLTARMDRLPVTAKHLLQATAVMGKEVALPLLQAVTEVPEEALDRDIRDLQAAEFLYETYALSAPVYTFKHILTQEVAYQSLVRRARQQYHTRIAQVLEAQFPEIAEMQPELLAYHYTEADQGAQAIPYWQRAGQRAVERSANHEAVSHFTKGLELLQSLPATPERARQELALHLALGPPLRMIKGHTVPEVEDVYTRAYELAQQVGEHRQQFSVLVSLWRLAINRARIQQARELAEQCFTLTQSVQDPVFLQEAHRMLGETLLFHGEPVMARWHLEQGLTLYDAKQGRSWTFSSGMDPGVFCLCCLAWTLWILGYPDSAMTKLSEALTLAQELSHAYSLVFALNQASVLYVWRREIQLAQERAKAVIRLASEYGFRQFKLKERFWQDWTLAEQQIEGNNVEFIPQDLSTWQAITSELELPHRLAMLADAHRQKGQVELWLGTVDEALAFVHKNAVRHYEAELYRLKGELLLRQAVETTGISVAKQKGAMQPSPLQTKAEDCFRQALDIAHRQHAKSLELRAAVSLSRLWQRQGKQAAARQMLAELYSWFTEGFDTLDLQEAQALLAALQ